MSVSSPNPPSSSPTSTSCFDVVDLRHASSSVQGRRPYNEDRSHSVHPLIGSKLKDRSTSFFAVYDGHGGEACAEWCSQHLHDHIAQQQEFLHTGQKHVAIERGFIECDDSLLQHHSEHAQSGTTCSCILVDHDYIYSGNCGDTRNILCRGGRSIELTCDHKPTDADERRRIEAGGAKISIQQPPPPKPNQKKRTMPIPVQAYVELGDAGLAVSRAFGDLSFKQNTSLSKESQVIICHPHLNTIRRNERDEFVLLASDGLWNFVDHQQACDFVRSRLSSSLDEDRDLDDIVNKLTQFALDKKSNDNVTAVLVVFPYAYDPSRLTSTSTDPGTQGGEGGGEEEKKNDTESQ